MWRDLTHSTTSIDLLHYDLGTCASILLLLLCRNAPRRPSRLKYNLGDFSSCCFSSPFKSNYKASHADPSTMLAMVEAGVIPGILRHLTSAGGEPLSSQQQQQQQQENPPEQEGFNTRGRERISRGHHHRTEEVVNHAQTDQSSPSILLAARLLYAFSVDPSVRYVH